jgi:hypothetical protein
MYDKFQEICLTGNLFWLIIEGEPDEYDLLEAWQNIIDEYCELVKTPKTNGIADCYKRIEHCHFKIKFTERCLEFLYDWYDEEVAMFLMEIGLSFPVRIDDTSLYYKQLERIETQAKSFVVELANLEIEYKRLNPEQEHALKKTEVDYEKDIAILSQFMGYRIDKRTTSVTEMCAIMNLFTEHNNLLKQKQNASR